MSEISKISSDYSRATPAASKKAGTQSQNNGPAPHEANDSEPLPKDKRHQPSDNLGTVIDVQIK